MDPVAALREIAYYKDRAREDSRRVMAYRNAADIVEALDRRPTREHGTANSWQSLPGIGPKTAKVITQAWAGREPDALVELREAAQDLGGGDIRAALRGDLHVHSNWSDGSAPIEEMMIAARDLGHEYCALTDHSPRLTIANGLSPERLRKQLDVIDELREKVAPMRILTGIEVDILEDGSLDQEPELFERLDVVVASVHSKLAMDAPAMTRRMINAVANGHADMLGHCTGRLVAGNRGIRPESKFDAEKVFTACRDAGTAVEINSRPERRDPPTRLLNLALEIGCLFSIDTDSHAPGQLDFLGYGAQRALDAGVPADADRQHVASGATAGVDCVLTTLCTTTWYYNVCMTAVPIRELNQNTAAVLARVKHGEQIEISERGNVIARLIPAVEHPLSDLMESGKLHPATISASGGAPRPSGPVRTDHEAGELLCEMRDAERY